MENESVNLREDILSWLTAFGFVQVDQIKTGYVFFNKQDSVCIVLDTIICNLTG